MLTKETATSDPSKPRSNVADRLAVHASERPDELALVACDGRTLEDGQLVFYEVEPGDKAPAWSTASFAYLDRDATLLARGLVAMGVRPGHRMALLVKPGLEFVTLVFALLRSGATMVLVDGGLGRKNIVRCLESTEPDGFVAIPQGHLLRLAKRRRFHNARLNVTVGRRWFWGGETLASLRRMGELDAPPTYVGGSQPDESAIRNLQSVHPTTAADDPAAIVFTSGSTGPPKGVVYRHQTFVTQCEQIQQQYDLQPGAIDLACFPLFGLFNVACGVTTVLPEMDFSRPASCDPKKLFAAANEWKVTQSFASPAVWERLSWYAEQHGETIPTLRKVFSCGAPVPARVIEKTLAMVHPDAELHTPYGATEALPVATIEAQEILSDTAAKTDQGAGVCVGKKFTAKAEGEGRKAEGFDWRVIRITDEPIATLEETEELPTGEIGELIVRGPQVSREYLANDEARMTNDESGLKSSSFVIRHSSFHNQLAKINDGDAIWHRMGDVGYFDDQSRFWYCGRKSQRVVTSRRTFYTECVEQVVNTQPEIARSALVGVSSGSDMMPVLIYEDFHPWEGEPEARRQVEQVLKAHGLAEEIHHILRHDNIPTDIRHNSKIRREELALWAAEQLRE